MSDTTTKDVAFAALITKVQIPESMQVGKFTPCLINLMLAGAKYPGFWSAEIIPPETPAQKEWRVVQRFRAKDEAESWQVSDTRKKLIGEFQSTANGTALTILDEISMSADANDCATMIVTDVKPGMEDEYFAWENKIQTAQAQFKGYRGAYMQPPVPGKQGQWATLLRFDSPEELEVWFRSNERHELLSEGQKFVKSTQYKKVTNAFPGWFPDNATTGEGPPNWKSAMLVLIGLFPIVMLEIRFLSPHLTALNPVVASVVNMALSVSGTTYVTMPLYIKMFSWWLFPKEPSQKIEALGILSVLAILAVEMLTFMLT